MQFPSDPKESHKHAEQAAAAAHSFATYAIETEETLGALYSSSLDQSKAHDLAMSASRHAARSYANYALEADDIVSKLAGQTSLPEEADGCENTNSNVLEALRPSLLIQSPSMTKSRQMQEQAHSSEQLHLQISRLKTLRDELLATHATTTASMQDTGDGCQQCSQALRRTAFLRGQLDALVKYTTELEEGFAQRQPPLSVISCDQSDTACSRSLRPTETAQQILTEARAGFEDLLEKLHTFEVQKADADEEISRLRHQLEHLQLQNPEGKRGVSDPSRQGDESNGKPLGKRKCQAKPRRQATSQGPASVTQIKEMEGNGAAIRPEKSSHLSSRPQMTPCLQTSSGSPLGGLDAASASQVEISIGMSNANRGREQEGQPQHAPAGGGDNAKLFLFSQDEESFLAPGSLKSSPKGTDFSDAVRTVDAVRKVVRRRKAKAATSPDAETAKR